MDVVKLLKLYCDEKTQVYRDDGHITLSKDDIIAKMSTLNIDVLKACRLGMIDPEPKNLCKLLHFATRLAASKDNTAGLSKSQKTSDEGKLARLHQRKQS